MSDKHVQRKGPPSDGDHVHYRGYDPLQASWRQTPKLNQAWLKNGKTLSLLQRTGFTVLSLLFVAFSLFGLSASVLFYRDADWIFLIIFGAATLFCFIVGVGGLRNVLRFPEEQVARWKR